MTRTELIRNIEQLAAVRTQQLALDTAPEVKAQAIAALDFALDTFARQLAALDG